MIQVLNMGEVGDLKVRVSYSSEQAFTQFDPFLGSLDRLHIGSSHINVPPRRDVGDAEVRDVPATRAGNVDVFGPIAPIGAERYAPMTPPRDDHLSARSPHTSNDTLPRPYNSYNANAFRSPLHERRSLASSTLSSPGARLFGSPRSDLLPIANQSPYGFSNRKAVPPDNRVYPERIALGESILAIHQFSDTDLNRPGNANHGHGQGCPGRVFECAPQHRLMMMADIIRTSCLGRSL